MLEGLVGVGRGREQFSKFFIDVTRGDFAKLDVSIYITNYFEIRIKIACKCFRAFS